MNEQEAKEQLDRFADEARMNGWEVRFYTYGNPKEVVASLKFDQNLLMVWCSYHNLEQIFCYGQKTELAADGSYLTTCHDFPNLDEALKGLRLGQGLNLGNFR